MKITALALLLVPAWFGGGVTPTHGEWAITPRDGAARAGMVQLTLMSRNGGNSLESHGVSASRLIGLPASRMQGQDGAVKFQLRAEAGVATFEGSFQGGRGRGKYSFQPAPDFAARLAQRGLGRPTAEDQFALALHDLDLARSDAVLQAFTRHGHRRPSLEELIRFASHGVPLAFPAQLAALGYRGLSARQVADLHDHGLDAGSVRRANQGRTSPLEPAELIRRRNHGQLR
jgi:hypothetical protein